MGVTDPRKLAVILRDLDDEMQRWSMKAGDTLNTANYTQLITREATHQSRRQSLITTEQYYEDEVVYRSRKQNVEDLLGKYSEAVRAANSLVNEVESKLQTAQRVLAHWTNELQKAIAWQKRAEERVRRAEAELAAAERALAQAERDLAYAEAELQRCRNTVHEERNSEGKVIRRWKPDCSGYAAAVSRCQAQVRACQQRVYEAQIELRDASAELSRAIARVKACEQAVSYAKQGVAKAELSLERAKSALAQAERALDHIRAAERALVRAGELLNDEQIKVEDMNINMQQCEDLLSEAQVHLFSSTKYEESAQRYRIMARSELQHRMELLYALNKPELLGGISGDGWLIGASSFTAGMSTAVSSAGGTPAIQSDDTVRTKDPTKDGIWHATMAIIGLSDLPNVSDVDVEIENKKLPRDQMSRIMQHLGEMIPLIQEGIGKTLEFWAARDAETKNDPKTGYRAAYEEYFLNPSVTVAKLEDDTLVIVNGQERIWLAKQEGILNLPVKLMKRSRYLQPTRFTHSSGEQFEIRSYVVDDEISLRLYNMTRRSKIPEVMTDGDATCIDIRFNSDGRAELKRFQKREQGFDAEMLLFAEAICKEKQSESLFFTLDLRFLNTPEKRDWFLSRGYNLSQDGNQMVIYKVLNQG